MLNKIIALSLCILILFSLCACKSESSQEKQDEKPQSNASSSNSSAATSDKTNSSESSDSNTPAEWQIAYLDYIDTREDKYVFYALVFINNDDIPELYMCGRDEVTGDAVCTLRNGAIFEQRLNRIGGGSYIEKSGKFANQNGNMGVIHTDVYSLGDKGFSKNFSAFSAEVIGTMENGDLKLDYEYYVNDQKVDKTAYDKAISDAFNFDKATRLNKDAVEYEEFKELVENYK